MFEKLKAGFYKFIKFKKTIEPGFYSWGKQN